MVQSPNQFLLSGEPGETCGRGRSLTFRRSAGLLKMGESGVSMLCPHPWYPIFGKSIEEVDKSVLGDGKHRSGRFGGTGGSSSGL
eukprot:scaffold2999_cov113-Cylindrotheca_fusiformis.AAC.8